MDVREFERLKAKYDDLKASLARAEGALASGMKRLADEFGCKSIEEAEELMEKLTKEIDELTEEFNAGVEKLRKIIGGE